MGVNDKPNRGPSPARDSLASYSDVRQVWEAARTRGYLTYEMESAGQAQNFMQRAYRFRKMLFKHDSAIGADLPGYAASTPYDHLGIRKEGKRLVFFEKKLTGKLYDEDGNAIEPDTSPPPDRDEGLEEAARQARAGLGLEIEDD